MAGPVSEITESFLFDAWDALASFERQYERLRAEDAEGGFRSDTLASLVIVSHRLRGTAALYSYPQLARLAELVERLFAHDGVVRDAPTETLAFLEQVNACVSSALERIATSGQEGPVGLDLSQLGGATLFSRLLKDHKARFAKAAEPADRPAADATVGGQATTVAALRQAYRDNLPDWEFFAPEVGEHIETIRSTLDAFADDVSVEDDSVEDDSVKDDSVKDNIVPPLFRATHTLKGAAYMMDVTPLGDLAHSLEDVIEQVREGELTWGPNTVELFEVGCEVAITMLGVAAGQPQALEPKLWRFEHLYALVTGEPVPDAEPTDSAAAKADASPPEGSDLVAELRQFAGDYPGLWEAFAPEATEYLGEAGAALDHVSPDAEAHAYDDALNTLLRVTHTLKGSAATVGLPPLSDLCRHIEAVLLELREGELTIGDDLTEQLRRGYATLRQMLVIIDPTPLGAPEVDDPNALASEVVAVTEQLQSTLSLSTDVVPVDSEQAPVTTVQPSETPVGATIRVGLNRLDSLLDDVGAVVSSRARLRDQYEQLSDLAGLFQSSRQRLERTVADIESRQLYNQQFYNQRPLAATMSAQPRGGAVAAPTPDLAASLAERFDELEFDSYSDMNVLTLSVAEMANDLNELQGQLNRVLRGLAEETEQLQGVSRRLRRDLGQTRMVPVGQLFRRLRRLLSRPPDDKRYRLELSGDTVDIDKLVLEEILDPLLQLVRNALVHGIEPIEERERQGKDPEGVISLRASHQGNYVYIEVADDGAGIDAAALKRRALEKGVRSRAELAELNDREAQQLIFLPGLSTAKSVTTAAGRGVGMDIVAERTRGLKGEIGIESVPGEGTRFTLRLPLTLLISEALLVEVGGQRFALGIEALQTLRYVDAAALERPTLTVEGEALPLYHLDKLLGLSTTVTDTRPVVVLRSPGGRFALAVDALGNIEEVVIRGLDPMLIQLGYLTGATVSSRDEVIVLLDPVGLRNLATPDERPLSQQAPVRAAAASKPRVLLADDSLSVRRIVGRMLARAGYEAVTVADGQAALEKLHQGEQIDVVLTDLEMPRMNGYELIEQLRRYPATASLPIVVITTRAGEKHSDFAFELGADDYLGKPVDDTRLLAILDTLRGSTRGLRAAPEGRG